MSTADTMDTASLGADPARAPRRLALLVAWCREEPWRVGELAFLPRDTRGGSLTLGRGDARDDDPHPRLRWVRQRPGRNEPRPPMRSKGLSRVQLFASTHSAGAQLDNRGRRKMLVDGSAEQETVLRLGRTVELENELVLLLVRRPAQLSASRFWMEGDRPPFGLADRFGMVGESPAAWKLRDELAFAAGRSVHVLLLGPSGSGKELAATTIHELGRSGRALVARNAATLPEGLVEAELFGNVKDYPNPGMKERRGLVGAADGSTLFMDEIGELPESQQAKLLRVLDEGGQYHRLGEDRARTTRLRLIGATNRSVGRIKHDLLARLSLRVELPSFDRRPEDIALLAHHLLSRMAGEDEVLRERFIERTEHGSFARLRPGFAASLVTEPLELGVRELSSRLWASIQRSEGQWLSAPRSSQQAEQQNRVDPSGLSASEVREALEADGWVVSRAYRALGLESRHVLHRLMRKHGIERS